MAENIRVEAAPTIDFLDERASAFHQALVFMRQAYPNMALMTYDNETHRGINHFFLTKMTLGLIGADGQREELNYQTCTEDTTCDNIPGGLKSVTRTHSGYHLTAELCPIIIGREPLAWEGGAVLHIVTDAPGIWLEAAGGDLSYMHTSPNKELSGRDFQSGNNLTELAGGNIRLTHRERPVRVEISAPDFAWELKEGPEAADGYGMYVSGTAQGSEAWMMLGFALTAERAAEIAALNPAEELEKVHEYYRKTLEKWSMHTPDKALDEAFGHVRLNLEYSWFRPYGWIESIHHWPTMWHMEQSAADEWAGYPERTRETLQSQLDHLLPSGAVPDMCCDGSTRHDWGGNNQFFFRELHHYVKMTGDLDFLKQNEHYLYTILENTFHDYDPAGKGVVGWDTQIGNQEDMEASPGAAAAPGSQAVLMLKLMSVFMHWLGKEEESARYAEQSDRCLNAWKELLVKPDLARPVWYEDHIGVKRLDTTYHGLCYPVIYGQVDEFHQVSFMDHLLHRLSGEYGEMFQSNHFGDHAYDTVPTWGMQAGSDMQPFATAAYAKIGYRNEAVRPLSFIAERVCGPYQRGSWPEAANETRFAYFSPSAGTFGQEVIESLFGIDQDLIAGITRITPCLPETWDYADLEVTGARISYKKQGKKHNFNIEIDNDTRKVFGLRIPPAKKIILTVDGKRVAPAVKQGLGWFELEAELGSGTQHQVSVQYTPIEVKIDYTPSVACGSKVQVRLSGAQLLEIDDRCGIFAGFAPEKDGFTARINAHLLDEYLPYGWIGAMNFARRLFALKVKAEGIIFDLPCVITVLPPVACMAAEKDGKIDITVVNNTEQPLTAVLAVAGEHIPLSAVINPVSEYHETVMKTVVGLTLGKNPAQLILTGEGGVQRLNFELESETQNHAIEQIVLDESMLLDKKEWRTVCGHDNHGFCIIDGDAFMRGLLDEVKEVTFEGIGTFTLNEGGFIPLATAARRYVQIPLTGIRTRKLYVVMCPMLDNHDMFSRAFTMELHAERGDSFIRPVYVKQLTFPGQLDTGYGNEVLMGLFSSYMEGVKRGVLPRFPLGEADYPDTVCPAYPSRDLRCVNRAAITCNTVFNLIEINLNGVQNLEKLNILCDQADSSAGIFAIGYAKED